MTGRIHGIKKLVSECGTRLFHSSSPSPWLFIGLGNPGDKYVGSRQNVGFEMIDAFAASQGIRVDSFHCKALFGKGLVDGVPVFLAKPHTFMNRSGESTGPLAAYYKLPLNRVLVIHDDMDLPSGVLRLVDKEGHRRHDGTMYIRPFIYYLNLLPLYFRHEEREKRLKSVMRHFRRNTEFPRLRIGIGSNHCHGDPRTFVLQKFNPNARKQIDAGLLEGADLLKQIVSRGVTETAGYFNDIQKYKHIPPIQFD